MPPISDERVIMVPVGCQRCMECRKQKARQWQSRLIQEVRDDIRGKFITLTLSDESIYDLSKQVPTGYGYETDNAIATRATRLFLERWRKEHKKSLKHWFITELGHKGTNNIHLHGIVWTDKDLKEVEKHWKYGHVWKGKEKLGKIENYVSERTVNYMVKYVTKIDEAHPLYMPKILTSAGIGKGYLKTYEAQQNKFKGQSTKEEFRLKDGRKIALPIYIRNKLYSENEREQLWLHKLDKQIRWINGEKISIANGEDEYYKLLKYYQKKNKEMGYGDDEKSWTKEAYEMERRNLKIQERIAKGYNKKKKKEN